MCHNLHCTSNNVHLPKPVYIEGSIPTLFPPHLKISIHLLVLTSYYGNFSKLPSYHTRNNVSFTLHYLYLPTSNSLFRFSVQCWKRKSMASGRLNTGEIFVGDILFLHCCFVLQPLFPLAYKSIDTVTSAVKKTSLVLHQICPSTHPQKRKLLSLFPSTKQLY
jgi:hypothetical protein